MSSLGVRQCLKVFVSKFQVQLTAEKGSEFLPCSTNQELDSTDRKSQEQNSAEFLNQVQACENA